MVFSFQTLSNEFGTRQPSHVQYPSPHYLISSYIISFLIPFPKVKHKPFWQFGIFFLSCFFNNILSPLPFSLIPNLEITISIYNFLSLSLIQHFSTSVERERNVSSENHSDLPLGHSRRFLCPQEPQVSARISISFRWRNPRKSRRVRENQAAKFDDFSVLQGWFSF